MLRSYKSTHTPGLVPGVVRALCMAVAASLILAASSNEIEAGYNQPVDGGGHNPADVRSTRTPATKTPTPYNHDEGARIPRSVTVTNGDTRMAGPAKFHNPIGMVAETRPDQSSHQA